MEFRDHAAKEASALAERLVPATTDLTRQRLRAFRSAIEGAAKALETALTTPPHIERDLQEFVARLADLAHANAEDAARRVGTQFEAALDDLQGRLRTAQDEHAAALASSRHSAERAEMVERQLREREQQIDALRAELGHVQDSFRRAEEGRLEAGAARDEEAAARATAEREVHTVRGLLDTAQAELSSITTELEMAIAARAGLEEQLAAADARQREADARIAQLEGDRTEFAARVEAAGRELAGRSAEIDGLRTEAAARDAEIAALSASLSEARAHIGVLEAAATDAARGTAAVEQVVRETTAHAEALQAELAARSATIADLQARLAERTSHGDAIERALADRAARIEALEAVAAERAGRVEQLEAALAERAQCVETLEGTLDRSLAESAARIAALESDLREKSAHIGTLNETTESGSARALELEQALAESANRIRDLETLQRERDEAFADLENQLQASVARTADHDRRTGDLLDDLAGGFAALSGATSIADVLHVSVRRLSAAYPRVALFRLKGNRLEGEIQAGFDSNTDIAKIVVPLGLDSLLTRAAASGRTERLSGDELLDNTGTPFGGAPTTAIALPVVVNGDTLAILYGDDGGEPGAARIAHQFAERYADVLLRHAVAVVMRLTTELKALAELRDYVKSLFNEIEEMYVADVIAGKTEDDVQRRLVANLEYARSIYATRVSLEGPGAASLLEDELRGTIETKGATPFGRALLAVAERSAQPAAEAC